MIFSSITFLFFFLPIILAAYFLAPNLKIKNLVLLIGSLFFYAWGEPVYVVLMIISICGNYFCARYLAQEEKTGAMKRYFIYAVVWNIGILFFFKYSNMVIRMFNVLPGVALQEMKLSLPIGISFYTFQALSYVIDVYRGKVKPQKSLLAFALYVTMFPQLIAGPIVQYSQIENRLTKRKTTLAGFGRGTEKFLLGLGKKVILANNIGMIFDQITAMAPADRSVLMVWIGSIAFTIQLYFDFSGYSDMAIGLGMMFGFRFPVNFDYPFISSSVQEFWRRWHITLGTWFREYVYIPLGGSRVTTALYIRNIVIVWGLTGLWHGANLNFLLWGLFFGALLLLEKFAIGGFLGKHKIFGHVYTLLAFVLGQVIFSITDFPSMRIWFGQLFGIGAVLVNRQTLYILMTSFLLLLAGALASTPVPYRLYQRLRNRKPVLAMLVLLLITLVSVAYLVYQSYNPFLYFRF